MNATGHNQTLNIPDNSQPKQEHTPLIEVTDHGSTINPNMVAMTGDMLSGPATFNHQGWLDSMRAEASAVVDYQQNTGNYNEGSFTYESRQGEFKVVIEQCMREIDQTEVQVLRPRSNIADDLGLAA